MNKIKSFFESFFWFLSGIFITFITCGAVFVGYKFFMPSYSCMRTVTDKKIISRISGEIFFDDGSKKTVSTDDYMRYAIGQETNKTCRSWNSSKDKRKIKK